MKNRITFSYYYGQEAELHSFYRIPKLLFTSDYFQKLSTDAKVLYGLMLDRMSLSLRNKWLDAEKRVFIYFSLEDTKKMLNCKDNKAIEMRKALEEIGLIECKRQGQGKPIKIYVKSFAEIEEANVQTLENPTSEVANEECIEKDSSDLGKTKDLTLEKSKSRGLKNQSLELGKTNTNNTKYNNTELNNTNLIRFDDACDETDEYQAYSELIRENIELDCLYERYPYDGEMLEGIYDLILETVLSTNGTVHIARNDYPVQLVKSKFLKLNSSHIEYVMESLKSSTSKVRNIKKYLLAALFNAPSTMSSYYQAEVNHDMPQYACAK